MGRKNAPPFACLDLISKTHQKVETQDRPEAHNGDSKFAVKRRKATTFASTLILMMIFTPSEGAHTIKPLLANQSVYFDPVAKAQLVRDKWLLIVYFDMEPYWEGIKTYNKITQYLDKLCVIMYEQSHCNMIVSQLRHDYQELEYYNELLLTQHFRERPKHDRKRRGLVDSIGYAQHFLFGVLDSRFAEQYTKDIESTRANEKYILNMWKNHTSLIESEFNLMKIMQTTIDKQHKSIEAKLSDLEKATKFVKEWVQRISQIQDFTLSAMAGNNLLQSLKRLQEVLLDTITDIYHGQISLHLLPPKQLRSELHVINSQTANDLKLPIQNIETDFHHIYSLLKVKARVTQKFVIFEVTFPLISREDFQLYKLIPIPHQMKNSMVTMVPASEYIAVNLQHDSYFTVTTHELDKCLYHVEAYMCDIAKPILRIENDKDFCDNNTPNHKCKIEKTPCKNKWLELNATSQYLYFYCDEYDIQIICNDHFATEQLNHAGIIRVSPECVIKGKDFSLHSRRTQSNQIEISPNIYLPEVDQINHMVNLTFPKEEEIDDSDLKTGFTKLAEKIESVKSAAIDIDAGISFHDIHQYTISYGLLAAALCVIVAWWAGCLPCNRRRAVYDEGHCVMRHSAPFT